MRDETVTISTLDKAIAGALEEYNADVQSKLRTLVDNAMRKLRQNVVCTRGARLPHAPA